MVRTSLHLLLGTLAIRRGAVVECVSGQECTECLAVWGLGDDYQVRLNLTFLERAATLSLGVCTLGIPMEIQPGRGFCRDIEPSFRVRALIW